MILYVGSFLLLLGPLVFIHEFGHYLFAKLFNVRVDVFSMGFGPKIFKKQWGETEYCVSIIPLGGYVKLYGQDPTEEIQPEFKNRSLGNLEPWKRFLVFVGGPLFNFLFAIFIFSLMMAIGEPHKAPVLERVISGSPAFNAGFRTGDVVTAIDRTVVTKFEDIHQYVTTQPEKVMQFRVRRGKEIQQIDVKTEATQGYSIYGEPTTVGDIDGLFETGRYTIVGISNPKTGAALAGFKTGDEIVTLNGNTVKSWEVLTDKVNEALSDPEIKQLEFGVIPHDASYWTKDGKGNNGKPAENKILLPKKSLQDLGLHSAELFVANLVAGSPSELAGLKAGDRLISVNQSTLLSFSQLRTFVQKYAENQTEIEIAYERDGKTTSAKVTPTSQSVKDPTGKEIKQFLIGVYPLFVQNEPPMFIERTLNPLVLTVESWSRALDLSGKTFISLKKLFFRQVSMGTLGGPLLIGKLAGDSMSKGAPYFLKVMALISISLAIFNILPIPILDGGHIFLLLIEVLRGKPITLKQTEMIQQVGLSIIVLLLVVVLFNDFSRVGIPALKHIFQ